MSKATQPCRACGGDPQVLGAVGLWCSECGEASGDGPPNIDGVLDPAEVEAARVRIGLSQRKAGQILGGGPRAFQKYEAGTQAGSVPMSRLLTLLANDPKRLHALPGAAEATDQRSSTRSPCG